MSGLLTHSNRPRVMTNSNINMRRMMRECMKGCRWCALIPITFGAVLFLLGYYLDAEVVRIQWLILTGFMVLTGVFMLIIVSLFLR